MKKEVFLIVNSQSGECRLRKTPSAGPMEYVFQVDLEIPDIPIPVVTITIPVPAAPAVVTEIKEIPFGVPWAISEGIVKVVSIDQQGVVILNYTDEGLARLYKEARGKVAVELELYHLHEYARKRWGLPHIYIEPERWEKLKAPGEGEEA